MKEAIQINVGASCTVCYQPLTIDRAEYERDDLDVELEIAPHTCNLDELSVTFRLGARAEGAIPHDHKDHFKRRLRRAGRLLTKREVKKIIDETEFA